MAHIYNSQLDAYTLYHKTHETPSSAIGPALPALGHALAGSIGTAISNLSIYPLDLIITRLQVQRSLNSSSPSPSETSSRTQYVGVIDAFDKIYEKEGLSGFYTGVLQDTGKSIADSFLFFLFYNYLRSSRLKKHGTNTTTLPALDELAVGALAGACSKFFTTPIANIVTRKQTSSMLSHPSTTEQNVSSIAKKIRAEKGLQGFWSGYSASLILTLNPSLTFFLYEFFKRTLLPRSKRDDPGARITFLMAAFSKSIASTITYPFSLAKARAQMSSVPPVDPASAEKTKSDISSANTKNDAEKAGKEAKDVAKRSTVFHTIFQIYRKEGAAALYEGLLGEIFKGFFSHGITMIVKESIHKLIIQTYFLVLKTLGKYPSPRELAQRAGDVVVDTKQAVGNQISDAGQAVRLGFVNASESVANGIQSSKEAIGTTAERVGVVGSNATEAAKTANDYASQEAGHLLGNAQEMLGGKIEDVGKGIKPRKD